MIVTKDCEKLFYAFIAEGENTKEMLRSAASIVQNDGVELSERDVNEWAVVATMKVHDAYNRQLKLITETCTALKEMKQ